ncbi:MAG: indole-3-glycerol-phosphate synthase [Holophagaceae bacterium]|nr:indole-3-glycerol-phosphate synthase [Holophagaceae bacterium]
MTVPDPKAILDGADLPPGSHLQRVVALETARVAGRTVPVPAPRPPRAAESAGPFEAALRASLAARGGAVIAEYKQASPSLGPFAAGTPLLAQLQAYSEGGAAAFSILTEPFHFMGSVEDLAAGVRVGPPCLYKGFVVAENQLDEAVACGAAAVLLIARVLKGHTAAFADAARARGLEPLVELHDLTELPFAGAARARLVGINARDLATFTLGAPGAEPLREAFPDALLIRESGLATPEDAVAAFRAGFDAVLMGEALMRSADPKGFLDRIFAALAGQAAS